MQKIDKYLFKKKKNEDDCRKGDSSRNLRPTYIWFNGATANRYKVQPIYKKCISDDTLYFVQPQYISELDYYEIFDIANSRIIADNGVLLKLNGPIRGQELGFISSLYKCSTGRRL